jgi:hypothetical protein
MGLGDHVHEDPLQRDLAPLPRPPRHLADGIQRQRVDRGVRVRPDTVVQANDLLPRLLGGGPHVGVGFGALLQPWQRLWERPAERLAKVPRLDAGHVLDQPEQVGARRHHGAAGVVLRQPLKLPHQRLAGGLQVATEVRLRI